MFSVSKSITQELNDISSAFGAIDQSYCYAGLKKKANTTRDQDKAAFDEVTYAYASTLTARFVVRSTLKGAAPQLVDLSEPAGHACGRADLPQRDLRGLQGQPAAAAGRTRAPVPADP